MFDIFIETVAALFATVVFFTILKATTHNLIKQQSGIKLVVAGFGLLLFSLIIDVTDNFPSLNYLVVIGDTEFQAFLEKVLGTLLGFIILAMGFRRWLPSIRELLETRESLDQLTIKLDQRVNERSLELLQSNTQLKQQIVQRGEIERELKYQALHDALTKLPNRPALMDFLNCEISRASCQQYFSAVLFFDLDNFKQINDLLGHETGDKVLKITSDRLEKIRRDKDFLGRLGGDEFVLVLTALSSDKESGIQKAQTIAQDIIDTLDKPIHLAEHKLKAASCIGIKLFPEQSNESVGDILRQADTALYHSKSLGSGRFSFFHHDMQKRIEERVNLAKELHEALESQQFYLHYQPQIDSNGAVFGVEALLRWDHPTRDFIGPDEFIPIAEEAGLIDKIGLYVLRQALVECSQAFSQVKNTHSHASHLPTEQPQSDLSSNTHSLNAQKGLSFNDMSFNDICFTDKVLKIAVNISPSHFLQEDFVEQILQVVQSFDQENFHLVLEVTESVVIQNIEDVSRKMETLRQMGIGISLDDFGTGYSSLNYIKRLPIDTLKIDRSFISDILHDHHDAAIVDAILAMTDALGVKVIAEGVETEQQRLFLQQRGCQLYQGYLFSRPELMSQLIAKGIFLQECAEVKSKHDSEEESLACCTNENSIATAY
ncbi:hypothetical protein MACH09_27180 [Vibrio sp. MACH09]|uniref:putative bifunctional diguanylate cyclase/phosphodiesterase n=1 Tax=Vibrio sp. MACH09 TaxID=3025122 RepID=UPI00278C9423|nr:EAL domain-containing protein [Vibrio sp. MACH09]GLO62210.1 hypothetical protein MACH09_27180 [Vibrio sp. MACH09]